MSWSPEFLSKREAILAKKKSTQAGIHVQMPAETLKTYSSSSQITSHRQRRFHPLLHHQPNQKKVSYSLMTTTRKHPN
jgi:hypothetical protein